MPNYDWGLYKTGLTEGDEISSTYEGRHITCTVAELITDQGSAHAEKGHACIFGLTGLQAVGVCFNSSTTAGDLIAIDTEGIWALPVQGEDDGGDRILYPGEPLFIHTGTCDISAIRDNATQIPFGYLLTQVGSGETDAISAVKVHWDPRSHWLHDEEMLYFGDAWDVSIKWDVGLTALEMLPLVDHTGAFNIGDGEYSMDVQIFGATATEYLLWDSALSQLDLVCDLLAAGNAFHITVDEQGTHSAGVYAIHVNMTKTAGAITAPGSFNGIASDLSVEANSEHNYAYTAYTQISGTPTIGDYSAYRCYMNDLGAACAPTVQEYQCMDLNIDSTNEASGGVNGNAFFRLYAHGGRPTSIFRLADATGMDNLIWFQQSQLPLSAGTDSTNCTHKIALIIGGGAATTHYLHVFSD